MAVVRRAAEVGAPTCPEEDVTARLLGALEAACLAEGFDLFATTTVGAYDRLVPEAFRLERPASASLDAAWRVGAASRCLVLVGNTRAAWPRFLDALSDGSDPTLASHPHPFDTWTARRLTIALAPATAYRHELRFAFSGPPNHFSALHLAEASGLAFRGPAGLAIHPRFGPWFGLRAALAIDLPWREAAPPTDLCSACPAPCKPALDKALAATQTGGHPVRDHWRHWLAVRDACPEGRAHRYSDEQCRWHYAHDRSVLSPRGRP